MHRERVVEDDLRQPAVRLVLDAHAPLFLDDQPLLLERVLVDAEGCHPIGLEPQDERQVLRGRGLPEHRRVFVRVGVALAAHARDERGVGFGLDVLRALEHHVLEQVREPGAARPLVFRADVIPDLHVHDRRRVVLGQDDGQAVWQFRDLVLELRRTDGRLERSARNHAEAAQARSRGPPQRDRGAPENAGRQCHSLDYGTRLPASRAGRRAARRDRALRPRRSPGRGAIVSGHRRRPRRASSASRRSASAVSWRRSSGRRRMTADDFNHSRLGTAG